MQLGVIAYALDRPLSGISRYTTELVRSLLALRSGFQATILMAGGSGQPVGTHDWDLKRVRLPGCGLLPGLLTVGNGWIPLRAHQLSLDLVHDPTGVTPLLFGAGPARTVVTVHDVFPWSCPRTSSLLDTVIYRCWLPGLLPKVDAVITVSYVSKSDIHRFLNVALDKVHVIPEGVAAMFQPVTSDQTERVRTLHSLPERYILFLGSVEVRKNLAGLLQAYARVKDRQGHLPLVVVGARGPGSGRIAQLLQELGLAKDVILTGYLPDADLPALYSGAELFVFPSLYEGFGLPPLEAMACGTPVVCSNAASLPEVVGDAAITIDPYDVEGLADAMHRVLSDRDLQEDLRRRGLERAAGFTWERTARETVAVYREVLNS